MVYNPQLQRPLRVVAVLPVGTRLDMHGWYSQWFHLSRAQFDAVHYAGMALYKLGILLVNLVPSLALHMIGRAEAH